MDQGFTLWITGLTGSGKTTLARLVEERLLERGLLIEVLDGKEMREIMSPDLGFKPKEIDSHLTRLMYISALLNRNGVSSIVAAVSPSKENRNSIRAQLPAFIEVFANCPLDVCRQRDAEGFYADAEAGRIVNVAGLDAVYEPPDKPEIEIFTDRETPEEGAARIIRTLEMLELVPSSPDSEYSEEDEQVIKQRLTDLGYI